MCHRPRVLFGLRDINYVYNVKVEEEEENVGAATAAAAVLFLEMMKIFILNLELPVKDWENRNL